MEGKINCEHDWVYKPKGFPIEKDNYPEVRQKRICKNCFRTERQGLNEREKYFHSYFAAPPWERQSPEALLKLWEEFQKA